MSIKFACACGKAYKVPEKYAGKRVRCKNCGETVAVPSSSSPISSARAAAVSQRSVMGSGRHAEEEADEAEDEDEGDEGEKGHSSGRQRAQAAAVAKPAQRRPGGDTQEVEAVDLTNELKKYQKKKDDDTLQRGVGKITLFEDGKATKAWKIEKGERSIGRSEKNDIKLASKSVSKDHLRLEYKLGTYIATDQNSLNGLLVNGKKVRRASLRDGDLLQLGEIVLRFEMGK